MTELVPHPRLIVDVAIARHGETAWNAESRIMGSRPIPLSAKGRDEATALGSLLAGWRPSVCVTSPVLRAVETAEVVLSHVGSDVPRREHPGLGEFDMGAWEGSLLSELRALEAWRRYLTAPHEIRFPGGETLAEIQLRAVTAVNEIVASTTGSVFIVTHAGVVRLLALAALGAPLSSYHRTSVATASVTHVRLVPGRPPQLRTVGTSAQGPDLL